MLIENEKKIDSFLNEVCTHIRFKDSHKEVKIELSDHIHDIFEELVEGNMNEDEAIDESIRRIGDSFDIGSRLNRVHHGKPDWITLILTVIFMNIGIFTMFLIKNSSLEANFDYSSLFQRSIGYSILGSIMAIAFFYFDYRKLKKYSLHLFIALSSLCIFMEFFAHDYVQGRSVLNLGIFNIDLICVSPFLFVITSAGILSNKKYKENIMIKITIAFLPLFLMLNAPSFVAFGLYYVGFLSMIIRDFKKDHFIKVFITLPIVIFAMSILTSTYRIKRLIEILNPSYRLQYHLIKQIHDITSKVGWFDHGFASMNEYIPGLHSEFSITFIIYSFGWFGFAILTSLSVIYLIRLLQISQTITDSYGKLIFSGFLSIITMEYAYNILMNVNLLPVMDFTLPFISYGRGNLIVHTICIGMILSIYRRRSLSMA